MEAQSISKRALAVFSPGVPERSLLDVLADLSIECHLLEDPQDALRIPPEDRPTVGLAILLLEYPSMSGPELAWRMRRRFPRLPILMLAEDLGTWEESDILDLGVNFIIEGPQDHRSFRKHLAHLVEQYVTDAAAPSRIAEYERLVNEIVGDESVPARIVDAQRIILYENRPMFSIVGSNVGRSCFEFWGASHACAQCHGFLAIETGQTSSRVMNTADGGKVRLDAVPLTLDDGSAAVLEVFHFLNRP